MREMEREREREEDRQRIERNKRREMEREREREEERQQMERNRRRQLEIEEEREREIEFERKPEQERQREREGKALRSTQDLYASQNQAQIEAPRSAFYPINTALPQAHQSLHQGYPPRSYTPTEAFPATSRALPRGQTQINRKFSLTERDCMRYRCDSTARSPDGAIMVPADHQQQPISQSGARWVGRQSACSIRDDHHHQIVMVNPPSSTSYPSLLRNRAMSENDLRFDSTYRRASPSSTAPLSELEERVPRLTHITQKRQKLLVSAHSASHLRGRHYRVASTAAGAKSRNAPFPKLRPVLGSHAGPSGQLFPPWPREEMLPRHNGPTSSAPSDHCARLCNMDDQDHTAVLKPISYREQRAGAEWERTHSPRVHSISGVSNTENSAISPEPSFPMSYEQQQQLQNNRIFHNQAYNDNNNKLVAELLEPESALIPSPAQSLEQEVDFPMETDIDDFHDEGLLEDEEPIRAELQCFALPVRVCNRPQCFAA
ncbi:hypothetical protein UPYG_G00235350 [Umbra pygmaea]|uniref:Uncharacterized protein n=1 Tax=Umbra pygmaea TaxID=75934 RepID=A0ABD0WJH2_UMBPY